MTKPVQVIFRRMAVSPALEREIRARAAWLETFHSDVIGCRVLVEIPHRHRAHGRPVHVRIELSLPGEDIVVSHRPTAVSASTEVPGNGTVMTQDGESAFKDAYVTVHDAFDIARRRLEDIARRQRGAVKTHRVAP